MANYLYNGVELPALPKWDKEQYPYAHIEFWPYNGVTVDFYLLCLYSTVSKVYHPYPNLNEFVITAPFPRKEFVPSRTTVWVDMEDITEGTKACYVNDDNEFHRVIWSNYDIVGEDGTVYLAASAPIPVNPIDPNSLVQGYLVGCRLRAMRGKA